MDKLSVYNKPIELTRPYSAASFGSRLWEFWCFGRSASDAKSLGFQYRQRIERLSRIGTQDSVKAIVDLLSLGQARSQIGAAIFSKQGVSKNYINRILKSGALVQLGQEADSLNIFTLGMVAYAADEGKTHQGGCLVATLESMISLSKNVHLHLNNEALGLRKLNAIKWILATRDLKDSGHESAYMFDGVILAAPMSSLKLEFRNATFKTDNDFVVYQPRHPTWFTTSRALDSAEVGKKDPQFPDRIIRRIPPSWQAAEPSTGAIEISDLGHDVKRWLHNDVPERMYRLLSDRPVTDKMVRDLLGGKASSWIARHTIEQGYPVYGPRSWFSDFELDELVWHTSAIEELHSSVGVSAWTGRNVANLAFQKLKDVA
ncbi:uncharacterized protein PV09_06311 [Verruconis gallopava]|uniref:Prenylcysteine lyase domain-containing protein n=1 Tax=Verruconis gallopava TaxID=253628 RepID=A0A0D1YPG8_9PEZI|nr:uncharacterized protein PV09_06311 [Verruconis gallopava]KIW02512.1 hypothetical protein PV09_06311 [Verruconis gallopava]